MPRALPSALAFIAAATLILVPASMASAEPQSSPGASLTLHGDDIDFGHSVVGVAAGNQVITFTNSGDAPASMSIGSASAPFTVIGTTCGAQLGVAASCTVTVGFTPTAAGPATGSMLVTSNGGSENVNFFGTGGLSATGALVYSPRSIDFGSAVLNISTPITRDVVITNDGGTPLTGVEVDVPTQGPVTVTDDCPTILGVGATCTATFSFIPTGTGSTSGSVEVAADGQGASYVEWDGLGYPVVSAPNSAHNTAAGTPFAITDPALGLLGITDGVGVTLDLTTQPAHGTVAFYVDGTWKYTPAAGWAGADPFTYTISDYRQNAATGTITVTTAAAAATGGGAPGNAKPGTLPSTGLDTTSTVLLSGMLLVLGAAAVVARRRSTVQR